MIKEWPILDEEFDESYMHDLSKTLQKERSTGVVYPDRANVFRALQLTPYDKVKVVIIGQDPYHNGLADGLAFSSGNPKIFPKSLINILAEVKSEFGSVQSIPSLEGWAKQGVLLLNTALTVRKGQAGSHSNIGWSNFTEAIIEALNKKEFLIYLLWGKYAQSFTTKINERHLVLTSGHPSPFSVKLFKDNGHFMQANKELLARNIEPINWVKNAIYDKEEQE